MIPIKIAYLHMFHLFLCATLVLTSSVNSDAKTSKDEKFGLNKSTISTTTEDVSIIMSEGGPVRSIIISSEITTQVPVKTNVSNVVGSLDVNSTEIKKDPDSIGQRVFARKGVSLDNAEKINSTTMVKNNHLNTTETVSSTITPSPIKRNVTTTTFDNKRNNATNIVSTSTNITIENSTKAATHALKKPKPKPTVTVVGKPMVDEDKPIPTTPTKSLPPGQPRKIDYIIPTVISMIAIPILCATTYIIYKQGRDCWDKRHYRRMDFLIDGMYND
ncbi:uncharacterized protein [Prorops nasuta]|uniref:uncharacterized protein n=1 Tax=Prorops nasuta TaxID=863751 RepID=UPI0034CF6FC8